MANAAVAESVSVRTQTLIPDSDNADVGRMFVKRHLKACRYPSVRFFLRMVDAAKGRNTMDMINSTPNAKPQKKQRTSTTVLVEGAVMVALSAVLSYIRVFHLPWGGSVTLLSMLPIAVYSIRHGIKHGIFAAFIFSLIQLGQGAVDGLFGWGLTPVMLIACIMLDYILPFTVIGLSGMLRTKGIAGRIAGTAAAIVMRFLCHYFSGVVIWHSIGQLWEGFATDNEWLYSLGYNAAYMLPELVFTVAGMILLFRVPQTKRMFT